MAVTPEREYEREETFPSRIPIGLANKINLKCLTLSHVLSCFPLSNQDALLFELRLKVSGKVCVREARHESMKEGAWKLPVTNVKGKIERDAIRARRRLRHRRRLSSYKRIHFVVICLDLPLLHASEPTTSNLLPRPFNLSYLLTLPPCSFATSTINELTVFLTRDERERAPL